MFIGKKIEHNFTLRYLGITLGRVHLHLMKILIELERKYDLESI